MPTTPRGPAALRPERLRVQLPKPVHDKLKRVARLAGKSASMLGFELIRDGLVGK